MSKLSVIDACLHIFTLQVLIGSSAKKKLGWFGGRWVDLLALKN